MSHHRKKTGRKTAIPSRSAVNSQTNYTIEEIAKKVAEDPNFGNILREVVLNYNAMHGGANHFLNTESVLADFEEKGEGVQRYFVDEAEKIKLQRELSEGNLLKNAGDNEEATSINVPSYEDAPPQKEDEVPQDFDYYFSDEYTPTNEEWQAAHEIFQEENEVEKMRERLKSGVDIPFFNIQKHEGKTQVSEQDYERLESSPDAENTEVRTASTTEIPADAETLASNIDNDSNSITSLTDSIMRRNFGYAETQQTESVKDVAEQTFLRKLTGRLNGILSTVKSKISEHFGNNTGRYKTPEFMKDLKAINALGMRQAVNEVGQTILTPTGKVLFNNADSITDLGTDNSLIAQRKFQDSNLQTIIADVHCYEKWACQNNKNLTNVNFSHTEIIEAEAFSHTALSGSIECPSALQIDASAFNGCTGIKELRTFYGTRFVGNSMLPPWIKLHSFDTNQSPASLRTTDMTGRSPFEVDQVYGLKKSPDGNAYFEIAGRKINVTLNAPAYKSLSMISMKSYRSNGVPVVPERFRNAAMNDIVKSLQDYFEGSVNIIQKDKPSINEVSMALLYLESERYSASNVANPKRQAIFDSVHLLAQLYPDDYNELVEEKNKNLFKIYNIISQQRQEYAASSPNGERRFMMLHMESTDSYVMFGQDAKDYALKHGLENCLVTLPGTNESCLYLQCNTDSKYYRSKLPELVSAVKDESVSVIELNKRLTSKSMIPNAYGKKGTMQSMWDVLKNEETREQKLLALTDTATKILFEHCDIQLENGIDREYVMASLISFESNGKRNLGSLMNYIASRTEGIKGNTKAAAEIRDFFSAVRQLAPKTVEFNEPSFGKVSPTYNANVFNFENDRMVVSNVKQHNVMVRFGEGFEHTLLVPISCITVDKDGRAANLFVMGNNSKKVSYVLDGSFCDAKTLSRVLANNGVTGSTGTYRLEDGKELTTNNPILSERTLRIDRLNGMDKISKPSGNVLRKPEQPVQQSSRQAVAPIPSDPEHDKFSATVIEKAKSVEYTPSTDTFHVVLKSKQAMDNIKKSMSNESNALLVYIDVTEQVKEKIKIEDNERIVISAKNLDIIQSEETGFTFKADSIKGATAETNKILMSYRPDSKGDLIFKKTDQNDNPIMVRDLFADSKQRRTDIPKMPNEERVYTEVNSR